MDIQTVITVEAAWAATGLLATSLIMLSRQKDDLRDWGVILFCMAGSAVYLLIAIRYFLSLPLWVGAIALGLKAAASTLLLLWVILASRNRR